MNSPPNPAPDSPLHRRNALYSRSPGSRPIAPWFAERLFSLFLAWCWGIISGASGINALVKSNNDKNAIAKAIPGPAVVKISIRDVYIPGVFITVFSFLIVFLTSLFLILTILRPASFRRFFAFQGSVLLLCTLCLLVNLIVETVFVARRSARVSATIGGVEVPQSVIEGVEGLLGVTGVYRHIHYLRNAVIFGWITFLFAFIASIVLFIAASRVSGRLNQGVEGQRSYMGVGEKSSRVGDMPSNTAAPAVLGGEATSTSDPAVPAQPATEPAVSEVGPEGPAQD